MITSAFTTRMSYCAVDVLGCTPLKKKGVEVAYAGMSGQQTRHMFAFSSIPVPGLGCDFTRTCNALISV